ncbi:hypothetical protein C5167_006555 [Papaver somniferum]|uniref:Uncharacterized protein n=1 Tax=Papaver somniferum TaxID=3469 RepID=A0A4Y7JGS8_PAPSO|nr:hypothetical protein C5167_006555 [Papaver somniferum]
MQQNPYINPGRGHHLTMFHSHRFGFDCCIHKIIRVPDISVRESYRGLSKTERQNVHKIVETSIPVNTYCSLGYSLQAFYDKYLKVAGYWQDHLNELVIFMYHS